MVEIGAHLRKLSQNLYWGTAFWTTLYKSLASSWGFSRSHNLTAWMKFTRQTLYANKRVLFKLTTHWLELYELNYVSYLWRGIGQTKCSFEHVSWLN